MRKTINDVLIDAVAQDKAMREMQIDEALKDADPRRIIKALYDRGISMKEVFGVYYELEEAGNGRMLDVQDALLVTPTVVIGSF